MGDGMDKTDQERANAFVDQWLATSLASKLFETFRKRPFTDETLEEMKHWKTSEVVELLKDLAGTLTVEENTIDFGVTDTLVLVAAGAATDPDRDQPYRIMVRGFCTGREDIQLNPADRDVELVEVNDCRYEDNPITARCNATRMLYHGICDRLTDAGFEVVPNMKAYF